MLANSMTATRIEIMAKKNVMQIDWEQGTSSTLSFNDLRRHCACSFCRASGKLGQENVHPDTKVTNAVAMGSTGLQIVFSDGHDRGIFPWGYLHAIGEGRGMDYFNEDE